MQKPNKVRDQILLPIPADLAEELGLDAFATIQYSISRGRLIHDTGDLHNMPQKQLEHKHLTAKADVDQQKNVVMLEDDGSANALVKLEITNTKGYNLPATGDRGVWMYGLAGILLMGLSGACLFFGLRKKADKR